MKTILLLITANVCISGIVINTNIYAFYDCSPVNLTKFSITNLVLIYDSKLVVLPTNSTIQGTSKKKVGICCRGFPVTFQNTSH